MTDETPTTVPTIAMVRARQRIEGAGHALGPFAQGPAGSIAACTRCGGRVLVGADGEAHNTPALDRPCAPVPQRAWRYYFLSRPPSIGTHPAGEIARESWYPRRDIPGTARPAWGWVEYPDRLPFEEVWRYELYPAGEEEVAAYWQWRDAQDK